MAKPTLMTALTKNQLKEAVYDMTVLTDEGTHPTSALEKVASSEAFTDDQLRLIARTYNTATSIDQRKKSSSLLEWLEPYPLADAEAVITRRSKQAAAPVKTASVWDTNIDRSNAYPKVSVKLASETRKTPPPKATVSCLVMQNKAADIRNRIREEEIKLSGLRLRFEGLASALRTAVKRLPEHQHEALKYAAVMEYGNDIVPYFETVFINPTGIAIPKHASAVDPHHPVLAMLGDLKQCGDAVVAGLSNLGKLSDAENLCEQRKTAALPLTWRALQSANAATGASAGLWDAVDNLRSKPQESTASAVMGPAAMTFGIVTPSERLALKKIETQAMLSDMLYNDPIISEYDTDKVYAAFNDLVSLAPQSAEQR